MEFVFDEKIINCMDEDVLIDSFQKMYNQKKYVQCVLYIEKKLSAFSTKFYDVMIIYLYSLINSNNKEKALKIVSEELSMPYIPALFEERFKEIYRELSYNEKENKDFHLSREKIAEILINEKDKSMIILAIVEMCKLNIRDFFSAIECFFKRKVENVYKVMLVDALRTQGVNRIFTFINEGVESKINPCDSENILESEDYHILNKLLEENISSKNPNLLCLASENLMLYLCSIYPKGIDKNDFNYVAYSIHAYSLKMQGLEEEIKGLEELYDIDQNKTKKIIKQLETACSI